jgi:hypothetical protein
MILIAAIVIIICQSGSWIRLLTRCDSSVQFKLNSFKVLPQYFGSDFKMFPDKNYGTEHYSRDPQLLGHSTVSQHFMEPEGSVPNSQELSTSPYTEPDQSSPHRPNLSLKDPF